MLRLVTWLFHLRLTTLNEEGVFILIFHIRKQFQNQMTWGFPGGSVVKDLPANEGARVRSLIWEDSTGCRASKPVHCNY